MLRIQGSIVAIVTPFHQDGSVNFSKLGELVDWQIQNGTDGIVALGTTGESATMTDEEDDAVCEYVLKRVNGRIPVIVGSGSNCTASMLEKSLRYQAMGAQGLLIIAPYYNKTNEEGMYRHFATVVDAVDIPCILYNVPGRTGCSISEGVVKRLAGHPNVMGIKEASGNMSYACKIARYLGPDFAMYSGNDDITVPILSIGGSGVISVLANILPQQTHDMVMAYLSGDTAAATAAQLRYLELINSLFLEVNPIPVKAALNMMGWEVGPCRMPLYEMSQGAAQRLRAALEEAGLLA
ncbi:MAG TPA: 4-hydroxy-tetrahydrodipicolinate synthase [Candidatus Pelethousia gallinarum]|nr:4-hydroxy-tetrahydrodipicolinate synthase [Candidatus Pelethousia gallinarum]